MDFCDWACLVVEEETAGNVEEPDDAGEPAVLGETDVGFHVLLVIQCWPLVVVVGVTVGENDGFINVGDELGAQGMLGVNESVLGLCCWVFSCCVLTFIEFTTSLDCSRKMILSCFLLSVQLLPWQLRTSLEVHCLLDQCEEEAIYHHETFCRSSGHR